MLANITRKAKIKWQVVVFFLFVFAFFGQVNAQGFEPPIRSGASRALYNAQFGNEAIVQHGATCHYDGILFSGILDPAYKFTSPVPACGADAGLNELCKLAYETSQLPADTAYNLKSPDCIDGGQGQTLGTATFGIIDRVIEARPASAVLAFQETFDKLVNPNVVLAQSQEAYFPGTGYDLLRPVQAFWGWSVTVALSFMIIIIIVIAFALLFRARLDGGQVIQLQNAIPNIVLAFILIPLSYSITGLFIDGITLGSNIIHDAFFAEGGLARNVFENGEYGGSSFLVDVTTEGGLPKKFSEGRGLYADDRRLTPFNVRGAFIEELELDKVFELDSPEECPASGCVGIVTNGNPVFAITDGFLGVINAAAGFLGPIIVAIFSVITLVTALRIMWKLLKRFLYLMFLPPLAPFLFVGIAVPGAGMATIIKYLRIMASVTLSYLATYLMFILSIVLSSSEFRTGIPGYNSTNYNPPLIGLGGAGNVTLANDFIFSLLAAGLFLSIPSTIDAIITALKADATLPEFLKAPIREFRTSTGLTYTAARRVGGVAYQGTRGIVGGASSVAGRRGNRVDPNDEKGRTYAEINRENRQKLLAQNAAKNANRGALGRAVFGAGLAAQRARLSAATRFGSGGKLEGFKPPTPGVPKFEVYFEIDGQEQRGTYTTPFNDVVQGIDSANMVVQAVKSGDDAVPLIGELTFTTLSGSVIGHLANTKGSAQKIDIELQQPVASVQLDGSDKYKYKIKFIWKGVVPTQPGNLVFSTARGEEPEVMIKTGQYNKKAKASITFRFNT